MPDPALALALATLATPGDVSWVSKEEVHCVQEIIWHEARNRHMDAWAGVAFAVLDRAAVDGATACHSLVPAIYPWSAGAYRERREARIEAYPAERVAWKWAEVVAMAAYLSSDDLPILKRPCPGNPTHFDRWLKPSRWRDKDRWKLPAHGRIECLLDGIGFWSVK